MTDLPPLPTRPECWHFAMDFLGDPEAPVIEEYVAALERYASAAVLAEREAFTLTWDRLMLEACECKMTHREVVQRFAEAIRARTTGGAND